MDAHAVLALLVAVAMVIGIIGTFLPLMPGITLVWAAAFVYLILDGIHAADLWFFGGISVLAVLAFASNIVLPGRRAEGAGAAKTSMLLGVVGAIIGFFAIPVIGLPVGGALGIWLGEVAQDRSMAQAWEATKATLIGIGLSMVAQFVAALWMFVIWLLWLVVA